MSETKNYAARPVASNLLSMSTPAAWAKTVSRGGWQAADHLMEVNRQIMAMLHSRTGARVLLIEAPPRHGKSEFISKYFPAWYLGMYPENRVMLTSYEANFARSWGRKARNVLDEFGKDWFNVTVSTEQKSAVDWETNHGGGMVTAGVGGALTGRGANLLIIDDPIKNAEEAISETIRDKQWDWWQSTASTRLEPGGIVVVMATRWHKDDLIGKLLPAAESGEGGADPQTAASGDG